MRIAVNCGHTLKGADSNGNEGKLNREVGYLVESKLKKLGHTVTDCTVNSATSVNNALNEIVNRANAKQQDLFLSIHHNATSGGTGTEILTYGAKSNSYAVNILRQFEGLGFKNRGIKDGSNLAVIRKTNCKALLIECCFYDNADDMQLWNKERISDAIVKGIDAHYQPIVKGQAVLTKALAPIKKIIGSTTADTTGTSTKKMGVSAWLLIGFLIIAFLGSNK